MSIAGENVKLGSVYSTNGWFNPFELLGFNCDYPIYLRGFPLHSRQSNKTKYQGQSERVVINVGLWMEILDVDVCAPHLSQIAIWVKREPSCAG